MHNCNAYHNLSHNITADEQVEEEVSAESKPTVESALDRESAEAQEDEPVYDEPAPAEHTRDGKYVIALVFSISCPVCPPFIQSFRACRVNKPREDSNSLNKQLYL